jgi:hypothetical protein
MRMTDLKPGWTILGNDGRKIGTIDHVGQNYVDALRVSFRGHLYIPATHIANVEREVVYLNLAKDEAEDMGWEQRPREADQPESQADADLHRHI